MKFCVAISAAFILFAMGWAGEAAAQSLTGGVGSASITQGERQIEWRTGANDAGEATTRVQYDYAFTDYFQLRAIGSFSRADGTGLAFDTFAIEPWFQWRTENEDGSGFNGGFRLTYGFTGDGEPDEAEMRLTITDRFADTWEWRANFMAGIETGAARTRGVSLESRWQVTRAVWDDLAVPGSWRVGIEAYNEFGNTRDGLSFDKQAHQLGSVLKASWDNGVYLEAGTRFGLTDASDGAMAKLFIGREF